MRPDLCHWHHCSVGAFAALDPTLKIRQWCCESVSLVAAAKPRLRSLDLTDLHVSSAEAVVQMSACLPATLESLAVGSRINQPDAMLQHLLDGLEALPRLRQVDLTGVLNARTLAGMRLLTRDERSGATPSGLARTLPALERLSVGFSTFSHLGRSMGIDYLMAQAACAPRLRYIGCCFNVDLLQPIDIYCRVCAGALYRNLDNYVVHPPQQGHISYEIYTDEPPIAAAVANLSGHPTRHHCARNCQGRLWLIDSGCGPMPIHVMGRRYGIACGPKTDEAMPGLAIALPSGSKPPRTAASESSSEASPEGREMEPTEPFLSFRRATITLAGITLN